MAIDYLSLRLTIEVVPAVERYLDDEDGFPQGVRAVHEVAMTLPALEPKFIDLSKPVAGAVQLAVEEYLRSLTRWRMDQSKGVQPELGFPDPDYPPLESDYPSEENSEVE